MRFRCLVACQLQDPWWNGGVQALSSRRWGVCFAEIGWARADVSSMSGGLTALFLPESDIEGVWAFNCARLTDFPSSSNTVRRCCSGHSGWASLSSVCHLVCSATAAANLPALSSEYEPPCMLCVRTLFGVGFSALLVPAALLGGLAASPLCISPPRAPSLG